MDVEIFVPVRTTADLPGLDGVVRRLVLRARRRLDPGWCLTLLVSPGVPLGAAEQLAQRLDGVRWQPASTARLPRAGQLVVEVGTLDLDAAFEPARASEHARAA